MKKCGDTDFHSDQSTTSESIELLGACKKLGVFLYYCLQCFVVYSRDPLEEQVWSAQCKATTKPSEMLIHALPSQ